VAAEDPCAQKKPGDLCVPELPTVAPVVPSEGTIWGLFARRGSFEIREYSTARDGVLAKGTCPDSTVAAALGAVDQQPAVVCAEFERGKVVFGRKLPNSQKFVWQAPETLTLDPGEAAKSVSHFALLERRLAVVYRTESKQRASGIPTTQWRLQIASGTAQLTQPFQSDSPFVPPQSEILCPRPSVTRCDQAPIAAYVADREMHVVLASGVSADRYLHLSQAAGKPSKVVPVPDMTLTGKSLKGPCVSKSSHTNLRVFVPARTLVSSLMTEKGERVGVIEHGKAAIAQGPDVYASDDTHCPPDVSMLAAFPSGSPFAQEAKPQWLRATQSHQIWLVGYGVPEFAVRQGAVTHSYKESFWVVRR
jgi:hypothetical protein